MFHCTTIFIQNIKKSLLFPFIILYYRPVYKEKNGNFIVNKKCFKLFGYKVKVVFYLYKIYCIKLCCKRSSRAFNTSNR